MGKVDYYKELGRQTAIKVIQYELDIEDEEKFFEALEQYKSDATRTILTCSDLFEEAQEYFLIGASEIRDEFIEERSKLNGRYK